MHGVVFLVAYAVWFYLSIVDAHERSRADDIVSAVYLERFQAGGTGRAVLHLVEENQGVAILYLYGRVYEGQVADDVVNLVAIVEDGLVFLLKHEVDGNHILVVVVREL